MAFEYKADTIFLSSVFHTPTRKRQTKKFGDFLDKFEATLSDRACDPAERNAALTNLTKALCNKLLWLVNPDVIGKEELKQHLMFLNPGDRKALLDRIAKLPEALGNVGCRQDGLRLAVELLAWKDPATAELVDPKAQAFLFDQLSSQKIGFLNLQEASLLVMEKLLDRKDIIERVTDSYARNMDVVMGQFPERITFIGAMGVFGQASGEEPRARLYEAMAQKLPRLFPHAPHFELDDFMDFKSLMSLFEGAEGLLHPQFYQNALKLLREPAGEIEGGSEDLRLMLLDSMRKMSEKLGLDASLAQEISTARAVARAQKIDRDLDKVSEQVEKYELWEALGTIKKAAEHFGFQPKAFNGLCWKTETGAAGISFDRYGEPQMVRLGYEDIGWRAATNITRSTLSNFHTFEPPPAMPLPEQAYTAATRSLPTFREAFDARLAQLQTPAPPPGLAGGPTG